MSGTRCTPISTAVPTTTLASPSSSAVEVAQPAAHDQRGRDRDGGEHRAEQRGADQEVVQGHDRARG